MGTAVVNVNDARQAVMKAAANLNGKIVDRFPPYLEQVSREKRLYIFNVSSKPWTRSLGDYGTKRVEACLPGREVSEPFIVEGAPHSYTATDMHKMGVFLEPGGAWALVGDIMMIGRGYDPALNAENKGLFVSETATPSKEQIKAAKAKLRLHYQKLVDEADALDRNNKRSEIVEMFREAAAALGVNKPWMTQEPREVANCPACQKSVDVEAVSCPSCSAIIDWERAKIYFPEKYLAYVQAQKASQPAK